MLLLLLSLLIVPIVAYRLARARYPDHAWLVAGVAFGVVAAPLSLGLYATYFIPYVGLIPGMIGLALALMHGTPGFQIARLLGAVTSTEVVASGIEPWFLLINAVVWGVGYGCIGWLIDRRRHSGSKLASTNEQP
jgi:ABC-type uncharacterized transport system permease subunit